MRDSKAHLAVDTLGQLLARVVTAANEQDRAQVETLAQHVQAVTEESVEVTFVDHAYTGEQPATDAEAYGIRLEVVKLPEAKQGFVLLLRRWVAERSSGWMSRFRRLVRDYEHLPGTIAGFHLIPFVVLMVKQFVEIKFQSA